MNLPPLQLIDHAHFCLQGEVEIDPSAAIAPGVLFQAEPGSRIVIAAGVCIGAGVVLHARQGSLVIEAGVSLGAGVLIVGAGRVGANACIGSSTTVLRPAIAPGEVVPPGSLLGDTSRQVTIDVASVTAAEPSDRAASSTSTQSVRDPAASVHSDASRSQASHNQQNGRQTAAFSTADVTPATPSTQTANGQAAEERDRNDPAKDVDANPETTQQSPEKGSHKTTSDSPVSPSAVGVKVYGQGQIDQLLSALFPHRQPLSDDES